MISSQSKILLNFSLHLDDETEIDSNFDQSPVAMQIGDGNMLPGFEKHLLGMSAGQSKKVTISAEDAFGTYNQENVQTIERSVFVEDIDLVQGMVVSFADAAGAELPGVILSVAANEVTVDFNHCLLYTSDAADES